MITNIERENLKPILGTRYSKAILEILSQYGVTKENGNEYSIGFISHVLNGRYENQAIEMAIYELYDRKQKISIELLKKRKKAATKKPEARTPGNF
jgi:hypothetical protein